jgi:hypothetical protein
LQFLHFIDTAFSKTLDNLKQVKIGHQDGDVSTEDQSTDPIEMGITECPRKPK